MSTTPSSPPNWEALKLPDLKAKCKQLGLTGYSKLNKAQLIARIQTHGASSSSALRADTLASRNPPPPVPCSTSPNVTPLASPAGATLLLPPPISTSSVIDPQGPVPPKSGSAAKSPAPKQAARTEATESRPSPLNPQAAPGPQPKTKATGVPLDPPPIAHATSLADKASPAKARSPVPLATTSLPRPTKQKKPNPKSSAISGPAYRKAKPGVVLTRTRPAADPLATPAPITLHKAPHRQLDQPNSVFLDSHFTTQVLRELRPEMNNPASAIMAQSLISSSEDVFTAALHFYIARLHTTLQMGGGEAWSVAAGSLGLLSPDIAKWPSITACQNLGGDLWSIETDNSYAYLCVGATGEVVHRSETTESTAPRADWAAYLASPVPLITLVRSKDSNEYPRGVFRGFKGMEEERGMAERVVLSSCVLQSFSGQSMTLGAMEAEWLGQPSGISRAIDKVELFLPESHQILSAHLTPHPSVGIIQRNGGYSEYVLRETGQVIGDEDGIAPLWQGVLACDHRGNPKKHPLFWAGWEERCGGD